MEVSLKIPENRARQRGMEPKALRCKPEQCRACLLHGNWCDGWETCCGGNFSESQERCEGRCEQCLGMKDESGIAHTGTWNVCGKPAAVRQVDVPLHLPEPRYSKEKVSLPAYLPVFARLPRGPLRALPRLPVAGLSVGDLVSHRGKPDSWLRYAEQSLVLCSEQDYRQDKFEAWYASWCRRARRAGQITWCTGIEFSCYNDHGNLSHFWSLGRALQSCNAAEADFVPIYPVVRLNVDRVFARWIAAVPNLFLPFFSVEPIMIRRLRRWIALAGRKISDLTILLAHTHVNALCLIPKDIRRVSVWLDSSIFATTLAGGRSRGDAVKTKPQIFQELLMERRARAERVLRG